MQVKDVMTKEVKWVEVPGNRAEALDLLRKIGTNAIPVVKRGTDELVGMVTLRKLFEKSDENQLAMLVDRDVPTVALSDKLEDAANLLLTANVRKLPVLKNGKLVGIITVRDIVYRAIAEMNLERPASDFMRPHVIAVWDGTPLKAAVEIMALSGFRALPTIDESGNLVGITDDTDILKVSEVETESKISQMTGRSEGDSWTWDSENRIYITKRELKVPDKLVRDVMTKELVTITRKTPVSRAAQLMKKHKIEQTPVLSGEGKFIGIVQDIDLLRAL
ncbi:MAG: CBS domain-containing protein [Candidatus Hadarchaeaceae archaeon]|nr:CBS domain-containing protein [Hadesarchaea archaeon]MDH5685980.1 CBS domain-containing protein [Hadesarchaea archaeon]